MTPLHITMLIHYHGVAEPYAIRHPEHMRSRAVREFRSDLHKWGLIVPVRHVGSAVEIDEERRAKFEEMPRLVELDHKGLYLTTDRGRLLVDLLGKIGDVVCRNNRSSMASASALMELMTSQPLNLAKPKPLN